MQRQGFEPSCIQVARFKIICFVAVSCTYIDKLYCNVNYNRWYLRRLCRTSLSSWRRRAKENCHLRELSDHLFHQLSQRLIVMLTFHTSFAWSFDHCCIIYVRRLLLFLPYSRSEGNQNVPWENGMSGLQNVHHFVLRTATFSI
jgi:hypothetical protein